MRCHGLFSVPILELRHSYTADDYEACGHSETHVKTIMDRLIDPNTWPMFVQEGRVPGEHCDRDLAFFEHWLYEMQTKETIWTCPPDIPRTFARERLILHAFSGRRRFGDVQHYLDLLQSKQDSLVVWMISVDIVIDPQFSDVANGDTRRFWLSAIHNRWILGFLGGPPCNTWSRARGRQLAQRQGPRIVRTDETPWGLDSLRLRELEDVLLGNTLLSFALLAMSALALTGGIGILEHPKEPNDTDLATIWRLVIMYVIKMLPGMQVISVSQGLFGAPSPKPTDLLVLNIPNIIHVLHSWRVTKELPKHSTIGQGTDGHFSTAGLKEYPPAFCSGLAHGMWDALTGMAGDASVIIPSDFLARCKEMKCSEFGRFMGPDLAGH